MSLTLKPAKAVRLRKAALCAASAFALLTGCASGSSPEPHEQAKQAWRTLAVGDVEALYASVRDLHPGYRDPEAPDFADRVGVAYREARAEADKATNYLDWRAATLGFMLSFRDGHTIYGLNATPRRVRWPGFLIDAQGDHYVIRTPSGMTDTDSRAPQGARVLSCDGEAISALLKRQLDRKEADWSKKPERIRQAYRLMIDYRLEGAGPISTCRVLQATGEAEVNLSWRTEFWSVLEPALLPFNREVERSIAARTLPNGAYWLSLGNFGDEGALSSLAESLRAETTTLRAAPYIVLDLRGNRGGNSGWGESFANLIYGEAAVTNQVARRDASLPPRHGKLWRATPAAAAEARRTAQRFSTMGPDMAGPAQYFADIAGLIERAPEGDRALVKDPYSTPAPVTEAPPPVPPSYLRPVYLLIDAGCFSSCVLALGALRAMGAITVGETTGQNEEYGEVTDPITTPSGLGRFRVPITIIRQRPEALVVPADRQWSGAMDDDAGIAAWIDGMAR